MFVGYPTDPSTISAIEIRQMANFSQSESLKISRATVPNYIKLADPRNLEALKLRKSQSGKDEKGEKNNRVSGF